MDDELNEWMNRWDNEFMNERMNEWMNEWTKNDFWVKVWKDGGKKVQSMLFDTYFCFTL